MPDDLTKKRPLDSDRINVHEAYEISYWTKKLKCSETKLKQAVNAVGTSVKAVEKYLGNK